MLIKIITISLVTALAVTARGQEVHHPGKAEHNPSRASIPTWILRIPRDRSDPIKTDLPLINQAAGFMRENQTAEMTIIGHAGGAGTEEYNIALGERRATAVLQLLVTRGVELARLKVKTASAAQPYSVSAKGRKTYQPHRVELVIR